MSAGNWKEMFAAAQNGDLELLRHHIKQGANPNYQHPEILCTPLVTAIIAGHTDIAIYLLEENADPNLRSYYDNMTPLEAATKYANPVVLEKLRGLGVQNKKSWTQKLSNLISFYKR